MKLSFSNDQEIVQYLDDLADYQVLERIDPSKLQFNTNLSNEPIRKAIYLDCESTGLSFDDDKPIELGILVFSYGVNSGTVFEIVDQYSGFEDPKEPLSEEIKQITGIKDEDLKDQAFDDQKINQMLEDVSLVIAHNAFFDRNMLESRFEAFRQMPWACSLKDIDWRYYQVEGLKLEYLLFKFGFFYSGHRALIDCFAGLTLLAQNLKKVTEIDGSVMNVLLKKARSKSYLIRAIKAPFEKKDLLKSRGYRWNNSLKCWWSEVLEEQYQEELNWLSNQVYQSDFPLQLHNINGAISEIDATKRHRNFN